MYSQLVASPMAKLGARDTWGYLFGVPLLRIMKNCGLHWDPPYFGKLPLGMEKNA